ncbi:MAG: hypothetical protein ACEPOW_01545 [Bacteroidales bacterium]
MKRKLQFIICTCLIFFFTNSLIAQGSYNVVSKENNSNDFWRKVFVGGGIGAQFGDITLLEISPKVGYRITDRWLAGLGLSYSYYKNTFYKPVYETHLFGASIFSQYLIFTNIFAQVEYGQISYEQVYNIYPLETRRISVPQFLVGGGYRQPLGGGSAIYISLLFDVIGDKNSPYTDPIIDFGFQIGL